MCKDSLVSESGGNSSQIELRTDYGKLTETGNLNSNWKGFFYTSEEIFVECTVPNFIYKPDGLKLVGIKQDGSSINIGTYLKD